MKPMFRSLAALIATDYSDGLFRRFFFRFRAELDDDVGRLRTMRGQSRAVGVLPSRQLDDLSGGHRRAGLGRLDNVYAFAVEKKGVVAEQFAQLGREGTVLADRQGVLESGMLFQLVQRALNAGGRQFHEHSFFIEAEDRGSRPLDVSLASNTPRTAHGSAYGCHCSLLQAPIESSSPMA